jgi:homoserine dehydrogenase
MAKGEEITGIYGILNATSNYILSELNSDTMLYEEAVRKAKNLGYAENDPSEDVDGWDAAYKLNILMNIGMGTYCDISDFQPDTIKQIGPDDIQSAKENDEVIKQIAYVKKINNGGFTYFIGPCRIKKDNFLSNVNGNNNIIFVEGKSSGIRAFYGQGAGAGPTASVMFDDFINLLQYNYVFHNPDYCNHIIKERISPEMFI